MDKDISILSFEKDKILKTIFHEQLNKVFLNKVIIVDETDKFFSYSQKFYFKVMIINLDTLPLSVSEFITKINLSSKNTKLIFYYQSNLLEKNFYTECGIIYLPKPFKIQTLIDYVDKIFKKTDDKNAIIYLMDHLVFYPAQKLIKNLKLKKEKHFTEIEVKLLNYLLQNKNVSVNKQEILLDIWGYKKNTNTHTLETHLYRLKQKLYNLETDLSFAFVNEKGKYFIKKIGDTK